MSKSRFGVGVIYIDAYIAAVGDASLRPSLVAAGVSLGGVWSARPTRAPCGHDLLASEAILSEKTESVYARTDTSRVCTALNSRR
jgi:hypothetical protein